MRWFTGFVPIPFAIQSGKFIKEISVVEKEDRQKDRRQTLLKWNDGEDQDARQIR